MGQKYIWIICLNNKSFMLFSLSYWFIISYFSPGLKSWIQNRRKIEEAALSSGGTAADTSASLAKEQKGEQVVARVGVYLLCSDTSPH